MDECEDHEARVSSEAESTVVGTTTTQTVIEKVVVGECGEIEQHRVSVSEKVVVEEEQVGGACEGGDVMVEVSGCEVSVDGGGRNNGEVSGGEGGYGGKRENLGDGDDRGAGRGENGGEVDYSSILGDRASERLRDSVISDGGENLTSGIVNESISGDDGLQDGETHDVERVLERKSGDEGGMIEMESTESGNGLHEDSVSHHLEARSSNDEIQNSVQDSMSPIMSIADGNKHNNAVESVNAVKGEGEDKGVTVVKCAPIVSEPRTKEEAISEKGDELTIDFDAGLRRHDEDETAYPPLRYSLMDKQDKAEGKILKVKEKLNSGSDLLETEVPDTSVAASATAGLVDSEGHTADGRPLLPDESLVEGVDQGNGCAPGTLLVDASAIETVAQFDSNMEDAHEVQEDADISEQAESPEQEEDEEMLSDSTTPQSNDGNGELDGHTAHELPHWPDESFVVHVDQGKDYTPVTSPIDQEAMVDSDVDDSQEMQEDAEVTDEEVESPDEGEVDEESVSYSTKRRSKEEKKARRGYAKSRNLVKDRRVNYWLPPENEGEFSVFDLVWGKVKSHPWWPGQIFHPFDSSEKAKKYFRKDCYLVAYFGDKSFAWNEGSVLKPFFKNFSQEEKQSNSESFQNAVSCALEEVFRRVELGLACSCISEEVHDKIKYQIVENAGIREESSKREGVDWSTGVDSFQPDKLIQYIKALALSPTSGASQLDLVIAKAQMLAFYRMKGCDTLPDFQYCDGMMACDSDTSPHAEQDEMELVDSVGRGDSKTKLKGPHRRKHNLKDIVYQRRKEKTLNELMGDTMYYFDGDFDSHEEDDVTPTTGSKRKASLYSTDDFTGQRSTKTISVAKVSNTASQQSFKVGECIRRVASQLTGSSPIMRIADGDSNSKQLEDAIDEVSDPPDDSLDEEVVTPKKEASIDELLSQLHLSAQDPMKGYSFLPDIVSFFMEFRNLAVSTQRHRMRKVSGRRRKQPSAPATGAGASATFEFDDRNDSYWTDMVIQNNSEAKPSKRGRKRKEDRVLSPDTEKPLKPRKNSRKQYFHGNHESTAELPSGSEKQPEELPTGPTELVMNFSEVGCIPSEVNLNKMFRRFGPLKEPETEIDTQNGRAKVVFKKRSDAEVAYSSATMFNIFGSTPVRYQLNCIPSVPSGTASLPVTDGQMDAT